MTPSKPGRLSIGELREASAAGELDTVLVAVADLQGRLQGKRFDAAHFLDEVAEEGTEGCGYVLASDVDMTTVDGFALSSWDDGYGDLRFRPDLATLRRVPMARGDRRRPVRRRDHRRHPGRRSRRARCSSARPSGSRHGAGRRSPPPSSSSSSSPTPTRQAWSSGYRSLTPANLYNVDYSLQGTARVEPLLGRIRREMRGAGMEVESAKGECHPGQHEITFRYWGARGQGRRALPVQARREGDRRPGGLQPHLHGEVRRAGGELVPRPPLAARRSDGPRVRRGSRPRVLGDLRALPGGAAPVLRECSLLVAPNVNSYKRYVHGLLRPDDARSGGWTTGPAPSGSSATALAASRVAAPRRRRQPVPRARRDDRVRAARRRRGAGAAAGRATATPTTSDAPTDADAPSRRPSSSSSGSAMARAAFGDEVVDHYVHAAAVELDAFALGGHRLGARPGLRAAVSARGRAPQPGDRGGHRHGRVRRRSKRWTRPSRAAAAALPAWRSVVARGPRPAAAAVRRRGGRLAVEELATLEVANAGHTITQRPVGGRQRPRRPRLLRRRAGAPRRPSDPRRRWRRRHVPRAARRRRGHRAVELPDADRRLGVRSGAGRRQHGRR